MWDLDEAPLDDRSARRLLSQLAGMMPKAPNAAEVAQRVLWLARQLVWCDSAVLFLSQAGKLRAEAIRSPYRSELLRDSGLGIREPIVHRALHSQSVCSFEDSDRAEYRIFIEEANALALPLHDLGVLYLGRRCETPFSEEEITHLVALSQQAYFAFSTARLSVSADELKREEARARQSAESLLNSVSGVVEIMGDLMKLREPEAVLECTGRSLYKIADSNFWVVLAGGVESGRPRYSFRGGGQAEELNMDAVFDLAQRGVQTGRTLSFVGMEKLTLPCPAEGIRSVLITPMRADSEVMGCLMLGSSRHSFTRRERELTSTLALLVGSHFRNLDLHRTLRETHESLKLSQAQLVQSSKMAAVGRLAAGVAHELNTPLGAMNLAVEGSLRCLATKPERAAQRLERALIAGRQLSDIIGKLLTYSKQSSTEGAPTELRRVAQDSLELIRHQLSLDGVQVELDLRSDSVVTANHNELQQVVINLLTNARDAVKSLPPFRRRVVLGTQESESEALLTVSDNGTGIDPDQQGKIFDPFFTTKEVGSGTGLGLSVSKELVEKYSGRIEVKSVFGEGTVFTLRFPRGAAT